MLTFQQIQHPTVVDAITTFMGRGLTKIDDAEFGAISILADPRNQPDWCPLLNNPDDLEDFTDEFAVRAATTLEGLSEFSFEYPFDQVSHLWDILMADLRRQGQSDDHTLILDHDDYGQGSFYVTARLPLDEFGPCQLVACHDDLKHLAIDYDNLPVGPRLVDVFNRLRSAIGQTIRLRDEATEDRRLTRDVRKKGCTNQSHKPRPSGRGS